MAIPRENSKSNISNTGAILFRSVFGWGIAFLVGVASVISVQYFDLSNMIAAQITIGMFGLTGGLSHALLFRALGWNVSWEKVLFLSIVWALCCVGGVTPLFFSLGTPLKMAVLAFYCFAAFGAIGGFATALVMRSHFMDFSFFDLTPYVITWSLSFGFGAIASDMLGEGLQTFLPELFAWTISFGLMALIIGSGGAYSIERILRPGMEESRAPRGTWIDNMSSAGGKSRSYVLYLILLVTFFYLNDFANIYVEDWRLWLLVDYTTVKLFPLIILIWLLTEKRISLSDLGIIFRPLIPFGASVVIATLAGLFIEQNGYQILHKFPGHTPLGLAPAIESPLWSWIDLTIGLMMVGIFEELIFRGYLSLFLSRYTRRSLTIIVVSALAFGLIHWSGGLNKIIVTSAVGAVFMITYLRSGSLPVVMIAHFLINFIDSANVIPKSVFQLL